MFADLRARRTVDWIEENIEGATLCKRSDVVKEVKGGKLKHNFSIDIKVCLAVDGAWSEWSQGWTKCSKTCGGGVQYRQRVCNNPSPSDGGEDCPGEHSESRICNTELCKLEKTNIEYYSDYQHALR